MYDRIRTVAPTSPVLTVEHAKRQIILENDEDETYLYELLLSADAAVENYIGQCLMPQTWTLTWNHPGRSVLRLPCWPVLSVDKVEQITDSDPVAISPTAYSLVKQAKPALLALKSTQICWPYTLNTLAFCATFQAGYASVSLIPADILQAIRMTVATWYQNRESVVIGTIVNDLPGGAKDILKDHVMNWGL